PGHGAAVLRILANNSASAGAVRADRLQQEGRTVRMRQHAFMRLGWSRGCALLVATLVILAGCASLKPARGVPITDINLIAGKWSGTMTPGPSGEQAFYLTITPDRKLTAAWGPNTAWGTVTLQNGQATY